MNLKAFAVFALLLAAGILALVSAAYIVPEGRQAIVTQFGKPVGSPVTEAGMHFKLPFIQDVRMIDRRILTWDGYPNLVPTKDKKYIQVDTTARWKVTDPLKFIQTVQDERGARSRLDAVLDAVARDVISSHNLVEAVRDSNKILDRIKELLDRQRAGQEAEEEEVMGEIDPVQVGREHLSAMIADRARKEIGEFGISVIDVQLRRIAYEGSVEKKVYERMISERKRIAAKIRSVGQGKRAEIQGTTSRDLQQIESEAYRKVQEIQGAADAKAIVIYAQALGQDPGFYEFMRTLEAYRKALKPDTRWILSTSSPFLDFFRQGSGKK